VFYFCLVESRFLFADFSLFRIAIKWFSSCLSSPASSSTSRISKSGITGGAMFILVKVVWLTVTNFITGK
jgi:hypothetical protein